jgi:hypothetical protein
MKFKYYGGLDAFSLPLGDDVQGAIREIEHHCVETGIPLRFCMAASGDVALLQGMFASTQVIPAENSSDYLYRAEDLINLSGRKYSGQRGHINAFIRNHGDYAFEEIGRGNIADVAGFFRAIEPAKESATLAEESVKVLELLDNYDAYGQLGGLIRVGDKVVAFAIGETLGDTLFVHVEKADRAYKGSHQMIANLFPKHYAGDGIEYVNREEDDGDPGLRAAKLAYHPVMMISKHMVVVGTCT